MLLGGGSDYLRLMFNKKKIDEGYASFKEFTKTGFPLKKDGTIQSFTTTFLKNNIQTVLPVTS